jgi:hypothetical protein
MIYVNGRRWEEMGGDGYRGPGWTEFGWGMGWVGGDAGDRFPGEAGIGGGIFLRVFKGLGRWWRKGQGTRLFF